MNFHNCGVYPFSFWSPFWWSARKLSIFLTSLFAKFCEEERQNPDSSPAWSPHCTMWMVTAPRQGWRVIVMMQRTPQYALHKRQKLWCMNFITPILGESSLLPYWSLLVLTGTVDSGQIDIREIFEFWVCEVLLLLSSEKNQAMCRCFIMPREKGVISLHVCFPKLC